MQRLVQKEKQVVQLQTELEKLQSQNPSENREAVGVFSSHTLVKFDTLSSSLVPSFLVEAAHPKDSTLARA